MTQLSVVIPHVHSDTLLEASILSVLEHRPDDIEIIVAHDGSYLDPYRLEDEVIYVQEDSETSTVSLINAGFLAACAPIVCVLVDGATVQAADWFDCVRPHFANPEIAAVAPAVDFANAETCYGLDEQAVRSAAALRRGRVDLRRRTAAVAGPTSTAGFYRRRTLLALNGWCDGLSVDSADIELGLALHALNLRAVSEPRCQLRCEVARQRTHRTSAFELAGLAVASDLSQPGLVSAALSALAGIFSPTALAWSAGLLNSELTDNVKARWASATEQLATREPQLRIFSDNRTVPATASALRHRAA